MPVLPKSWKHFREIEELHILKDCFSGYFERFPTYGRIEWVRDAFWIWAFGIWRWVGFSSLGTMTNLR